ASDDYCLGKIGALGYRGRWLARDDEDIKSSRSRYVDARRHWRLHRPGIGDLGRSHAGNEHPRRAADRPVRISLRNRLREAHRRDRIIFESHLGHDGCDLTPHLLNLPDDWLDRWTVSPHRPFH